MRYIFWGGLVFVLLIRVLTFDDGLRDGDKVQLSARVLNEPIQYDNSQAISIRSVRFYLPIYPKVEYGDFIKVQGTVDSGRLKDVALIDLDKGKGLYGFRNELVSFYKRVLNEPYASLMGGVVIGSKSGMPSGFWEKLKTTGTAHIVVASGTNVAFAGYFLLSLFLIFMKRGRALVLTLLGIWAYVMLSGFDAPLVRAGIMGSITFSAQIFGKLSSAIRALLIGAALMLIVRPFWIYDLGFMLSFLATASLILFEPYLNRKIHFVPSLLRESLSTTLAAQIGVVIPLYHVFGTVSLLSPLTNTLVLWTVPVIMVIGSVSSVLFVVSESLAKLVLVTAYPVMWWFVGVVNIFS